jgi:hypothetical protein
MSDPLGLTPEQRAQSDLASGFDTLVLRWKGNMAAIEALPPGTIIRYNGQDIPVEAIR